MLCFLHHQTTINSNQPIKFIISSIVHSLKEFASINSTFLFKECLIIHGERLKWGQFLSDMRHARPMSNVHSIQHTTIKRFEYRFESDEASDIEVNCSVTQFDYLTRRMTPYSSWKALCYRAHPTIKLPIFVCRV